MKQLATLKINGSTLHALPGLVGKLPNLPFHQYTGGCKLDKDSVFDCAEFPASASECKPGTPTCSVGGCTGTSVKLNKEDCDAWKGVVHPSTYFLKAPTPICSEAHHYLDPCSCDALVCSDRGEKIIGLDLGKRGLTANMSADESLGHLVNLQRLTLMSNYLEGSIPTWVSKLTSLTNLSMWRNRLSGNIDAVAKLKTLEYLSLGDNTNLTFQLDAVSMLSSLSYLSLTRTNVSGALDGIKQLTSLTHLHLSQSSQIACGKTEEATRSQTCCMACEVYCPGQCTPGWQVFLR
jgi:Leucine-rich repeat (LRR) protein